MILAQFGACCATCCRGIAEVHTNCSQHAHTAHNPQLVRKQHVWPTTRQLGEYHYSIDLWYCRFLRISVMHACTEAL
jgi:hypothetical protein